MFEIYLIRNTHNGKVYVGKTCQGVSKRWTNHKSAARKGSPIYFYRALRKYGFGAFKVNVIGTAPTQDEANRLETYWITQVFQSHLEHLGYNGTLGGDGTIPNEETRKKMAEIGRRHKKHTPEAIEKIRVAMLGTKWSPERKKKLSDWRRAHPTNKRRKQILSVADGTSENTQRI